MRASLSGLLVDPRTRQPLRLDVREERAGEILEGTLTADGRTYAIANGIPRFVDHVTDAQQQQTQQSFGYKWQQEQTYTSPSVMAASTAWLVQRYGFRDAAAMRCYFGSRRCVLDAGCGGGMSAADWMTADWRQRPDAEWIGVDISDAVDVARQRLGECPGTSFVQADVLHLPFGAGTFDTIFSEGVLHHTPSTRAALASLVDVLAPGGEILFYVYRKKGPIREFADDWIRQYVAGLDPAEAWEALRSLTALGKALADLHAEVEVTQDIPYLGISAGRYDVQRFVYWNFLKLFWNDSFTFDENHHVNFDWYHPRYAHRQTESDVRGWCADFGLSITRFDAQESGYTVRAIRRDGSR